MKKLNDQKNKRSIQEIMRAGKDSEFWQLILEVLDENIDHQTKQIEGKEINDYPANEYKVQMEILKGRKNDLAKLKELPETIIMRVEEPDQTEPFIDVYELPELT